MLDHELDPRCPLCRGLRPRGWPENWDCQYVGERIDLYWFPKDIAILPAQSSCAFCSFIRIVVDHLCRQANHSWPTTLPIRGEPVERGSKSSRDKVQGGMELFRSRPYSLKVEMRPDWPLRNRDIDIYLQDMSKPLPWLQLQDLPTSRLKDTSSDAAVRWVKSRLASCARSHKVCGQRSGNGQVLRTAHAATRWLQSHLTGRHASANACSSQEGSGLRGLGGRGPKRLLDIGRYPTVRLVETAGNVTQYACLSHCWGGSRTLTTETSTLELRLHGIKLEQMPATFRDAISFLHRLDIRYLWIDSLCILQDNEYDWLEHSGLMGDIYSEAYLTIAATRAQDGSAGLFSTGESTISWNDVPLILRERPSHPTMYNTAWQAFPLLHRAWVAQEMLLSRRVVHFCEGSLVFECMEGWHCTCGDDLRNDHNSPGLKHRIQFNLPAKLSYGAAPTSLQLREKWLESWRATLLYYTDLKLTFEKDRLPAISSLARRFASATNLTYAAGLWVEDLPSQLLWHHSGNHSPSPRNAASTAPSWSWASTTGKVTFYGASTQVVYFALGSVTCVPLSEYDPYGQLLSARLELSAHLLPLRLWHKSGTRHFRAYHDGCGGLKVSPEIAIEYEEDGWASEKEYTYFGMPVTRTSSTLDSDYMGNRTMYTCLGLILRQRIVDDEGGRVFERVALFECPSEHGYGYDNGSDEWSGEKLHMLLGGLERETVVIV